MIYGIDITTFLEGLVGEILIYLCNIIEANEHSLKFDSFGLRCLLLSSKLNRFVFTTRKLHSGLRFSFSN